MKARTGFVKYVGDGNGKITGVKKDDICAFVLLQDQSKKVYESGCRIILIRRGRNGTYASRIGYKSWESFLEDGWIQVEEDQVELDNEEDEEW